MQNTDHKVLLQTLAINLPEAFVLWSVLCTARPRLMFAVRENLTCSVHQLSVILMLDIFSQHWTPRLQ